jgi:RNA polymerase sigma-70 factor (ECF subfamily)
MSLIGKPQAHSHHFFLLIHPFRTLTDSRRAPIVGSASSSDRLTGSSRLPGGGRVAKEHSDADDWLPAARAGSREALGTALDKCRRYLLGVAEKELDQDLRAKGGASDIVQETFIDAQKLFVRFEGKSEEELLAWLRQLLLHNVAGFTRRFRAGKRNAGREALLNPDGTLLPADCGTPSAALRGAEESAALERALAKLSADYQQVLRCRYQDDLTFEEIGQRMDRTANAARKLWVRAIQELQQQMNAPLE